MYRIRSERCGWGLFVLFAVLFSGCVSAPVQEMSDARQAVEAARAANAAVEASDAYIKATAHMRYAESELQTGDYKNAREHATWAKTHALVARKRALARQAQPKE
jgi:pyridoxine 5'-phosphate synthase PdxJ